ncbi:MAG: transglycosylase SLT domain-containing protein [Candidatus Thiodiazotropha sp.]
MRQTFTTLVVLLTLFNASLAVSGDSATTTPDIDMQRSHFLAAEAALEADDIATFRQLELQLKDYPLYPYLVYQETLHSLEQQTPAGIKQVLQQLQDTPLRSQLLDNWLALLAREGLWHTYLSFSEPGGSVTSQCDRLHALLKTGHRSTALENVTPLWLSGHSRPKACDPVFDAWIAAGNLDQALVWKRVNLAMQAGDTRLARYLKRFLPDTEARWVDRWLGLYRDPARVADLPDEHHPMLDDMAVQAVRRLAWRDVDAAYEAWRKLIGRIDFNDWQHLQVARSLMGGLSRQQSSLDSGQITALLPKKYLRLDTTLSDKQFQLALQNDDWQSVLATLDSLPKKDQQSERWLYWRARALISLDQIAAGETLLKRISSDRSYYGFLAAQRLGHSPSLMHERMHADPQLVTRLEQLPGLLRARELHRLDRALPARREWNLALAGKHDDELRAAARLAEQWDWPSQVIITLTRLRQWNDLELRFPLAHRAEITSLAQGHGIDKAWVYAILRQESAFMTDAKSAVGARGLMQLMPRTAKAVASELSEPMADADDLYQPEVNIKLGTGYLNKIYRQLQENPVLATAAYNAGPMRVEKWLPEKTQPADIWIETVPLAETREYLKRVMAYTVIYNYRLGQDPSHPPAVWLQPIEGHKTEHPEPVASASGA